MKRIGLPFVAALALMFANGFAQKPSSPPDTQEQKQEPANEDRVYSKEEVDKKAVVTNRKDLNPDHFGSVIDCPDGAKVIIQAVFRRSGKVTDIKVKQAASCSLDRKAARIVKSAKFEPAVKDGVAVSQSVEIEYGFRKSQE
jgi:TonB family protein